MTKRILIKFLAMKRPAAVIGLLLTVLLSCNPERVKYTKELKQEMADMKIKRITNADLVENIDNLGGKVAAAAQKELTAQLQQTTNPAEQAKLCQLQNLPKTKAISNRYALTIKLLGPTDVQNKSLSVKEREILDAYLYNAEQKLPQISNIQKINDTLFIYNAAVPTENPICQTCFGSQKTPLAVWRIAFSKREVIRRMNASSKK
jgi:hypothetical protein